MSGALGAKEWTGAGEAVLLGCVTAFIAAGGGFIGRKYPSVGAGAAFIGREAALIGALEVFIGREAAVSGGGAACT